MIFPKGGPVKFMSTMDFIPIKHFKLSTALQMPHLDSELSTVAGAEMFLSFDFRHCYWQLLLHRDCMDLHSLRTLDRIFTSSTVFHKTNNAVAHIQASVQAILGTIVGSFLAWKEDILMFAETEFQWLKTL